MPYDEQGDRFIYSAGQQMKRVYTRLIQTTPGYVQTSKTYNTHTFTGCSFTARCHPVNAQAGFTINHRLSRLKAQAWELLLSEEGVRKRKQRVVDVEPVFGQFKQNRNFKLFRLRGLPKIDVEMGLAAMAHNIAKVAG